MWQPIIEGMTALNSLRAVLRKLHKWVRQTESTIYSHFTSLPRWNAVCPAHNDQKNTGATAEI